MKTRSTFVFAADRLPVAVIAIGVGLALVPFVVPLPPPALALLLVASLFARSIAPVHQHQHAHFKIFGRPALNRAYDVVLLLAGGNITPVWELQHCVGHHGALLHP